MQTPQILRVWAIMGHKSWHPDQGHPLKLIGVQSGIHMFFMHININYI